MMKFVLKKRTPQSRLGRIGDITIDGAQGTARGTSLVAGHAERKLENITIANLRVKMLAEDRPDKRATDALIFANGPAPIPVGITDNAFETGRGS